MNIGYVNGLQKTPSEQDYLKDYLIDYNSSRIHPLTSTCKSCEIRKEGEREEVKV